MANHTHMQGVLVAVYCLRYIPRGALSWHSTEDLGILTTTVEAWAVYPQGALREAVSAATIPILSSTDRRGCQPVTRPRHLRAFLSTIQPRHTHSVTG